MRPQRRVQRGVLAAQYRNAPQFATLNIQLKKALPQDLVARIFANRSFTEKGKRNIVRYGYTPNRFRIITTFSFSLDSEKDWAKRQATLDATIVRERVIEQIDTQNINLGMDAGNGRLFFPLGFGASWRETKRHDPEC